MSERNVSRAIVRAARAEGMPSREVSEVLVRHAPEHTHSPEKVRRWSAGYDDDMHVRQLAVILACCDRPDRVLQVMADGCGCRVSFEDQVLEGSVEGPAHEALAGMCDLAGGLARDLADGRLDLEEVRRRHPDVLRLLDQLERVSAEMAHKLTGAER